MSADTKPYEAPCLGVLWSTPPLQLACSSATLEASRWDLELGDTLQVPWGLEGQQPSMVQAWGYLCS